ncbi:protein Star-like [Palaemon carinicauda]|uniref:protein Star-like n=1 Tax=Palaemon carinicauda TaxID=392227 RepID=UPI0035B65EED
MIWQLLKRKSKTIIIIVLSITVLKTTSVWKMEKETNKGLILSSLRGNDSRILKVIQERYLVAPSSLPYNLSTDPLHIAFSKSASWRYINHYLKEIFTNQTNGFFVEAGALDGEFLSNSLWLEQSFGWTGLLIEPDKDSFQHLLHKHRRAWLSNTCLTPNMYPKEAVHVSLRKKTIYEGIPWNFRGSSHELNVSIAPKYDRLFQLTDKSYSMTQCFPLASYLWALNITTVDFLSLDIQGREQEVMKSFPWRDITIRVIVAEFTEGSQGIVEFMETVGYTWLNSNEALFYEEFIFIRKEELVGRHIACFGI